MPRQKIGKKSDLPKKAVEILQNLEMLNDFSNQVNSIGQKIEQLPTYQFDEVAIQRLELLRNAFNQFQFEMISIEQQYCEDSVMPFDLAMGVAKVQAKIWAFEMEIKTLETYLCRRNGETE